MLKTETQSISDFGHSIFRGIQEEDSILPTIPTTKTDHEKNIPRESGANLIEILRLTTRLEAIALLYVFMLLSSCLSVNFRVITGIKDRRLQTCKSIELSEDWCRYKWRNLTGNMTKLKETKFWHSVAK